MIVVKVVGTVVDGCSDYFLDCEFTSDAILKALAVEFNDVTERDWSVERVFKGQDDKGVTILVIEVFYRAGEAVVIANQVN